MGKENKWGQTPFKLLDFLNLWVSWISPDILLA